MKLCETLGAYMLVSSKIATDYEDGVRRINEALTSGAALEKFKEFVENQGGDSRIVDDYSLFGKANHIVEIKSDKTGFIDKSHTDFFNFC